MTDTILSTHLYPYALEQRMGERSLYREGCLLGIRTSQGAEGVGECAPLPGWSQDWWPCAEQLQDAARALEGTELRSWVLSTQFQKTPIDSENLASPVRFALESALAQALAKPSPLPDTPTTDGWVTLGKKMPPYAPWFTQADETESILQRPNPTLRRHLQLSPQQPTAESLPDFSVYKIKVQGIDRLQSLELQTLTTQKLRIDANQSLDAKQADQLCALFNRSDWQDKLDFIEEPFASSHDYHAALPNVPVARDESLLSDDAWNTFLDRPDCDTVILKPMFCGGIERTKIRIAQAQKAGLRVVLTSTLASSVESWALMRLAYETRPHEVHGISTGLHLEGAPAFAYQAQFNAHLFSWPALFW